MGRKEGYEEKTEQLIMPLINQLNFELVDVEFVKEGSDYYLRVYIDKNGGVSIDDCVLLSRQFNEILDRENYITEAYTFEVSSPGLTRPLKKEKDYQRSIGKLIEIKCFKPVNKLKEFTGVLEAFDQNTVTIEMNGENIVINRDNLALIRLAYCE